MDKVESDFCRADAFDWHCFDLLQEVIGHDKQVPVSQLSAYEFAECVDSHAFKRLLPWKELLRRFVLMQLNLLRRARHSMRDGRVAIHRHGESIEVRTQKVVELSIFRMTGELEVVRQV